MNKAENHARSAIISSGIDNCISRTMTQREINKMPMCFSCPGDCKELSKKTRRSTHNFNQAIVSLPHEPRIQKQIKKENTKRYQRLFKTSARRQERYRPSKHMNECACTSKSVILDVGMEKEQKQGRVSVLPIPAFHHCELYYMYTVYSGTQEWVIQIPSQGRPGRSGHDPTKNQPDEGFVFFCALDWRLLASLVTNDKPPDHRGV